MKSLLLLWVLFPALAFGQVNIIAEVKIDKLPEMTIFTYRHGPVFADTAYAGQPEYILPKYEPPRHNTASRTFWRGRLLNALNDGDTLSFAFADTSGPVFPGTVNQNVDAANWLANRLTLRPEALIMTGAGVVVYEIEVD